MQGVSQESGGLRRHPLPALHGRQHRWLVADSRALLGHGLPPDHCAGLPLVV